MQIRRGEMEYDELMENVDALDNWLLKLYNESKLPETSDSEKLESLYKYLMSLKFKKRED